MASYGHASSCQRARGSSWTRYVATTSRRQLARCRWRAAQRRLLLGAEHQARPTAVPLLSLKTGPIGLNGLPGRQSDHSPDGPT